MSDAAAGAAGSGGTANDGGPADSTAGDSNGAFTLTSTAFMEGQVVPATYKCLPQTGQNLSPPLAWTGAPATAKSFAMTLIHNQVDMSIHWVLWDIPPTTMMLPENVSQVAMPPVPAGSKQVKPNVDGSTWYGYQGPCPQAAGVQNYQYTVWALDVATLPGVTPDSTSAAAMTAVKAHQLGHASLNGTEMR
jgi:Raf kinase inhibitor-like YbhB/YbcL family protein